MMQKKDAIDYSSESDKVRYIVLAGFAAIGLLFTIPERCMSVSYTHLTLPTKRIV